MAIAAGREPLPWRSKGSGRARAPAREPTAPRAVRRLGLARSVTARIEFGNGGAGVRPQQEGNARTCADDPALAAWSRWSPATATPARLAVPAGCRPASPPQRARRRLDPGA